MSFSDCGLFVNCDSCSQEHLTGWYAEGSKHICFDCRPDADDEDTDDSSHDRPINRAVFALVRAKSEDAHWVLWEKDSKHGGLHPIGGKVEDGEELTSALIRELVEELGCTADAASDMVTGVESHWSAVTYESEDWFEYYYVIDVTESKLRELKSSSVVSTLIVAMDQVLGRVRSEACSYAVAILAAED